MTDYSKNEQNSLNILDELISKARAKGADAADAVRVQGISTGISWRLGDVEEVERSEAHDLGLRVLFGKKQAFVSSNDTKPELLDELVDRAVSMARNMPEDDYCGLADPALLARSIPDLDLYDPQELSNETLIDMARTAEETALSIDGVTNSEGSSASFGHSSIALATSGGFTGAYSSSNFSAGVSVIAGEGTKMERDHDYDSKRHFADLRNIEEIGRTAGERAVSNLNPRKMPSGKVPVVFSDRVSSSLLGHFAGAISGAAVARGTSFLKDSMGETIFNPAINIVDDPHRIRGAASKPFDGEGVANDRLDLVKEGALQCWILNSASARQLNLTSNGRASRGTASPPGSSTTNLYMEAGDISLADMIKDIKSGLYITSLIGFGVNGVTGDYSRGASGFWIEDGEIAFPVSELTVAGNLKDMFLNLTPADDLTFRFGTNAPSLRIDGMMVAGT
ncbi:TldD/PmbA family protein [Sneathiella chinensis]|uniref:Modulator protein n=1 Tax=Sneathiella chinensis TaxID=349750 RepID=A0ABQ5U1W7_9PROT|nr:TldD/PmbA family protein [Sneathiella chinensis]GLQ05660.1 modulator protein [Sneathiella chinensis]